MSSKELNIEADDITIVQGDAVRDYFVKVTSVETGVPLEGIPLNITFYNENQSMVNEVITNEYGVASIPLLLTGGSWFVDAHFKGNEEYKPFVVTREVTVEKFVRLESSITSENTFIDINEQSMNGTYYTIYLKDSYNRPIVDEPINFKVEQTGVDNPQTYVDVILKTDVDGKIELPFLSCNENVKITSEYKGCTRFKPVINADIVAFAEVEPRNTIEFRLCNLSDYIVGEPSADDYRVAIEYKIGTGRWNLLSDEDTTILDVVVSKEGNNRDSNRGWIYFNSMGIETYKVTLFYEGTGNETYDDFSNTYPFCRTFTFENTNDTRKTLDDFIENQWNASKSTSMKIIKGHKDGLTKTRVGRYARLRIDFNFETPTDFIYIGLNGLNENYPHTLSELDSYCQQVIKAVPYYWWDTENGGMKSYVEIDIVVPSVAQKPNYGKQLLIYFLINENDYISEADTFMNSLDITETSMNNATITQTGFGYNGQTYQNIDVTVSNPNASMHEKINDFYVMRLIDNDTLEEFYFYSYLVDNITPSHDEFELIVGNWELYIVSSETENYKGSTYTTTAELTTEDRYYNIDDFFYDYANWNNYGEEPIIIEGTSIHTVNSNQAISVTDKFTDANRYSLIFDAEIEDNSLGSLLIGADATRENRLTIANGQLELYKGGNLIDQAIAPSNLTGTWEIKRNGNTWEIYHENKMIYTTTEIGTNTLGLMNGIITIYGVYVRYDPVAEITPSTNEYDGTIFGSDWHIEFREDHMNFVDYGMLPSGAVGGGLVLINDVPLPTGTDLELDIDIRYNNKRFERLNKLYGEIQARVYEDVSNSDLALEYANVLCSPVPIPNAKTIFTRHSDEGTLYYIKPNFLITDEEGKVMQRPQYMCNPYIQYKGGVECYTQTNISLFDLENQFSPVFVGNDLVRAEFHRRSGYIVISRYDDATDSWYSANVLKLSNNLKLSMNKYNDDFASISFGDTTWEFYRGRPFIVVKHPNTDIRILKIVDRVYCETIYNEESMGFIEEHDTMMSTFNPQTSIQQFKQDLHIGENIRADNFDLYEVDTNNDLLPLEHNATLSVVTKDNDNALQVYKGFNGKLAVNFPSSSLYVKKPSNTFSLYIGDIDVGTQTSITIRARGFDENGEIHIRDGVQYGLWADEQTFTVNSNTTDIRATFTCPNEVEYIDFVVILNSSATSTVVMKNLLCHEGDSEPNWDVDRSLVNANKVEITFDESYYANLYFEKSPTGLCIIRPNQKPFTLRKLTASDETVLAPYMKKSTEWDKPSQVFLEYLNANRQTIDIDWEEF